MTAGSTGAAPAVVFKPRRDLRQGSKQLPALKPGSVESTVLAAGITAGSPSHWEYILVRSSLIYSSDVCEKEVRSSKQPRNSSTSLFPTSTGEGWELRTRSSHRGCNPDTAAPTQPKSRLSQLKTQQLKDPWKASPSSPPLSKQEGRRNWGTGFTCQGELGTAQRKLLTAR